MAQTTKASNSTEVGKKPIKKITPISDTEIKELVELSYIHKPTKNKVYWISCDSKRLTRTLIDLRDNHGWNKTRILDIFTKEKSKETELLKLKGILVENEIYKIGQKSVGKFTDAELRNHISKNWTKYENMMKDHHILIGNIISDGKLKPNLSKLTLFK